MRDDELTAPARTQISPADLLRRIALLIDGECGGSPSVLASRAGIGPGVAARLEEGDERALTVETLLAILHAFPAHAHWLIAGESPPV